MTDPNGTNPQTPIQPKPPQDELAFGTTPNFITLGRIFFVPVVVGLLFLGDPVWDLVAAIVFGVASATDYLDGYVARKTQAITVYGKLLDPLADKFLVVSSLVALQHLDRIHPVIVILLICRELAITGLRALASAEGVIIPASASAKWKTATQMVAIPLLMVKSDLIPLPLFTIGTALIYISLAISLWSAKDYAADFFVGLREKRRQALERKKKNRDKRLRVKWGKKRGSASSQIQ